MAILLRVNFQSECLIYCVVLYVYVSVACAVFSARHREIPMMQALKNIY